eukprot:m.252729 g.252729  ORF g.252729 m.252729 type:complete len:408 (+) comp15474_c0_seq2:537-1760(+)
MVEGGHAEETAAQASPPAPSGASSIPATTTAAGSLAVPQAQATVAKASIPLKPPAQNGQPGATQAQTQAQEQTTTPSTAPIVASTAAANPPTTSAAADTVPQSIPAIGTTAAASASSSSASKSVTNAAVASQSATNTSQSATNTAATKVLAHSASVSSVASAPPTKPLLHTPSSSSVASAPAAPSAGAASGSVTGPAASGESTSAAPTKRNAETRGRFKVSQSVQKVTKRHQFQAGRFTVFEADDMSKLNVASGVGRRPSVAPGMVGSRARGAEVPSRVAEAKAVQAREAKVGIQGGDSELQGPGDAAMSVVPHPGSAVANGTGMATSTSTANGLGTKSLGDLDVNALEKRIAAAVMVELDKRLKTLETSIKDIIKQETTRQETSMRQTTARLLQAVASAMEGGAPT